MILTQAGQSQSEGSSECEMEKTEDEADVGVEGEAEDDDDTTNMSGFDADLSTISPEVSYDLSGSFLADAKISLINRFRKFLVSYCKSHMLYLFKINGNIVSLFEVAKQYVSFIRFIVNEMALP